jgi:glutamine synthetase
MGFTVDQIREQITAHNIQTVRVTFIDNSGVVRARNVPAGHFARAGLLDGVPFPSAMFSVDTGGNFVPAAGSGIASGYTSWLIKPLLDTFVVLPYVPGTAKMLADVYDHTGALVQAMPRQILNSVLEQLDDEGFTVRGAAEFEFYVFKSPVDGMPQPTWTGRNCYAEVKQQQVDDILTALATSLNDLGLGIEEANTEYGPGQFEISTTHFAGVKAADMAIYYKMAVKEIMFRMGYTATFMTKPLSGQSGSGSHFHHSLYDKNGRNAFDDPAGEHGLSDICRWFIGGQLEHAAAVTALANPTVNSYRRLRPYSFAPSNVSWGLENRFCYIRIPHGRGKGTHIENRVPGADNNPYVMMAGIYAAGLDGIRRRIEPIGFIHEEDANARADLAPLPRSMAEALAALKADTTMVGLLGEVFVNSYLALKGSEVARFEEYRDQTTDWEVREYLELF